MKKSNIAKAIMPLFLLGAPLMGSSIRIGSTKRGKNSKKVVVETSNDELKEKENKINPFSVFGTQSLASIESIDEESVLDFLKQNDLLEEKSVTDNLISGDLTARKDYATCNASGYCTSKLTASCSNDAGCTFGDTTAPTLSAISSNTITTTSANIVATSNEAGTMYYVITTSATAPSNTQVLAGQDNNGVAATKSGNSAVTAATSKSFAISALSSSTQYYYYFAAKDAAANTSTVSSGNLKTLTVPSFDAGATNTLTVLEDSGATDIKAKLIVTDTDTAQTLTWSQNSAPTHGTLNFTSATATSGTNITSGGTITYTPTANYNGSDSFIVQVSDATYTDTITINTTVTAVNDIPTMSATGSSPTFSESGSAVSLYSGSAMSAVESDQNISQMIMSVTNISGDGSTERLVVDGTNVSLANGTTGTSATNSYAYSVALASGTATVTLDKNDTSANWQTLVDAISYQHTGSSIGSTSRVATITSIKDNGGTTNSGVDTNSTLSIVSTVTLIPKPTITGGAYDYNSNVLTVTGTDFVAATGATNDINVTKLTFTGEGSSTYTITNTTGVEIASATQFTVTLSGTDLYNIEALLNKDGNSSNDSTVYNIAGAEDWANGFSVSLNVADLTSNAITVSNYTLPAITSATYDVSNGQLAILGTNLVNKTGATNDLNATLITLTGEGGTYTLTSPSVELTSETAATITLNATDKLIVHGLLNKNGTTSSSATTYNLAGAEDWLNGTPTASNIVDLTGNAITVSNVATPTITSAVYDSDTGIVVVTGTNLFSKVGSSNDVDISTLTFTGGTGNATYTITSATDVEITSATSFSVTLSGSDKTNVDALLDQIGTSSTGGSTYNLAGADNWLSGADTATNIADATNAITVSISPKITSATYNASTGSLVVTGTNIQANGGASDITASKLTLTGEGSSTYTLTDTADVNRDSVTQFTLTLSATDKAAVNQILNKDGTTSTGTTTYNVAVADDWNSNVTAGDTSDTTSNAVTVSSTPTPAITSTTYDANTGVLTVTGTGFTKFNGATNDINVSKLTFTGEGSSTYTLTNGSGVEITNGTTFSITLNATDKAAVNLITNKNGTSSTNATTYNVSAAEDWTNGADSAVNVVDTTNAITTSNVPVPTITSATYSSYTSTLTVTGTGFLKANGSNNDVNITKLAIKGQGASSYTLTNTTGVEITSGTEFSVVLNGTDTNGVNALINKDGLKAIDNTVYNLAAAEDWTNGADAATTTTVDATGNAITATINDTPDINTTFSNVTIAEDSGITNYEINISDGEGSDLNLTIDSNDTSLITVDQNWTNMITQANWNAKTLDFNLSTVANANGVAKITVTLNDTNKTSSKEFNVTVSAVNDAPTITAISNFTKAINFSDFNLTFNGVVDADKNDLNISFETNDSSIITIAKTWNNNVSYTNYFGKDFNLSFASVTGKTGTAEINVSINDGTTITREEFNITVADTTPDTFSFTALTGQAISSSVTSSAVTITGMGDSIAISITGGEYQIDSGTWTSTTGTINNNSSVALRVTTSSSYSTATSAILTIGTLSSTFSATTTTAPVVASTPTSTYVAPVATTVVEPEPVVEPVVEPTPVVEPEPVTTPTNPQDSIPKPTKNITITIIIPDTGNGNNAIEDKKIIINEVKTGTTIGEVKESKTDVATGITTTSIALKDNNGNDNGTLDFTSEIDKKDIIVTTTEDGVSMNSKLNKEDGTTESIDTKVYTNGTSQTVSTKTDKDGNTKSVVIQSLVSDTTTNTAKDGVTTTQRTKDDVTVKASATKDGTSEHKVDIVGANGEIIETKATSNVNNSAVTILEDGSIQTNATTTTADQKTIVVIVEGKTDGRSSHLLELTDKSGNTVITKATSDIKGAQTVISKNGNIATSATFKEEGKEDIQLSVEANADGSATHKVMQNGVETKATSLITGAKTSMAENGKITTEAQSANKLIINGQEYIVKGVVVTLPNGESYTEFEKVNVITGEKLALEKTVSDTTPFEAGNDATLTEQDGLLKLEINTKVTRDILF